jgi:hypothetical protein
MREETLPEAGHPAGRASHENTDRRLTAKFPCRTSRLEMSYGLEAHQPRAAQRDCVFIRHFCAATQENGNRRVFFPPVCTSGAAPFRPTVCLPAYLYRRLSFPESPINDYSAQD